LSEQKITPTQAKFIEESINSDNKTVHIRLREGEYQYDLAKEIATFQLELKFPDAKDLTKKLYGEEKTNEAKFIRMIQTILKKMEKSGIVRILPKSKPWELQRYALSSFKFLDLDKNLVILATPQQIEQTKNLLRPVLDLQSISTAERSSIKTNIFILTLIIVTSNIAVLWSFLQPIINLIVFVPSFYIAIICSLMLGKLLSQK
jgi:hypothetical protein